MESFSFVKVGADFKKNGMFLESYKLVYGIRNQARSPPN